MRHKGALVSTACFGSEYKRTNIGEYDAQSFEYNCCLTLKHITCNSKSAPLTSNCVPSENDNYTVVTVNRCWCLISEPY